MIDIHGEEQKSMELLLLMTKSLRHFRLPIDIFIIAKNNGELRNQLRRNCVILATSGS